MNSFEQAAEAGLPEYSAWEAEKEWLDDGGMHDWLELVDSEERKAASIASKAAELVGGDRDRQHGAKKDNFDRIATVWNAWLDIRKDPVARLNAHDVGVMMTLMKLARTQSGAFNIDDYVDACGYAACAGEVAGGER